MSHEPHPVDLHVGQRILMLRKLKGLSRNAVADQLDVSFQQLEKYERGANRVSASKLWEIARVLGVPMSYFYEGIEPADLKDVPEDVRAARGWLSSAEAVPLAHNMLQLSVPMRAVVASLAADLAAKTAAETVA